MSISEDSEDEEEIRKRLYADFDQVSINDTNTEKSFIFEHK
jgi:acyl-CoA-binding protein